MRHVILLSGLMLLSGCGETAKETKNTVTAPVDNIQKNVDYYTSTQQELKDTAKKRADTVNGILDQRKKAEP